MSVDIVKPSIIGLNPFSDPANDLWFEYSGWDYSLMRTNAGK